MLASRCWVQRTVGIGLRALPGTSCARCWRGVGLQSVQAQPAQHACLALCLPQAWRCAPRRHTSTSGEAEGWM